METVLTEKEFSRNSPGTSRTMTARLSGALPALPAAAGAACETRGQQRVRKNRRGGDRVEPECPLLPSGTAGNTCWISKSFSVLIDFISSCSKSRLQVLYFKLESESVSRSVVSDSLQPRGL